jgi:hypothetical protein
MVIRVLSWGIIGIEIEGAFISTEIILYIETGILKFQKVYISFSTGHTLRRILALPTVEKSQVMYRPIPSRSLLNMFRVVFRCMTSIEFYSKCKSNTHYGVNVYIHDIIPVESKPKSYNSPCNLLKSGGQTH